MEEAVRPAQSPAVREGRLTLFVGYAKRVMAKTASAHMTKL